MLDLEGHERGEFGGEPLRGLVVLRLVDSTTEGERRHDAPAREHRNDEQGPSRESSDGGMGRSIIWRRIVAKRRKCGESLDPATAHHSPETDAGFTRQPQRSLERMRIRLIGWIVSHDGSRRTPAHQFVHRTPASEHRKQQSRQLRRSGADVLDDLACDSTEQRAVSLRRRRAVSRESQLAFGSRHPFGQMLDERFATLGRQVSRSTDGEALVGPTIVFARWGAH